ncbi:MAG: hypothetical protein ACKVP6_13810 [Mycobacterium sp.]
MIAARIGPTGKVKFADAVANASGGALVVLAAGVVVWEMRRDARLVNSVAVPSNATAAEPSPVRMLRAEVLTDAVDDAAFVELCFGAAELISTAPPPRVRVAAVRGRAVADFTPVEATLDAADSADPVVSASAAGVQASTEPIPNIRASAPTRPTERECLDAPRR